MILECPNCDTKYEIPVQLPPEGRKVRCASCSHIWIATPPEADEPKPASDDTTGDAIPADAAEAGQTDVADQPNLEALDEITENEIIFKDEEGEQPPDAETASALDAEKEPEKTDESEGFSDMAMEEAFSAAVAEAGLAEDDLDEVPESPPIVIGKAKRKGRRSLPVSLAAGWAALALFVTGVFAFAYYQRVTVVRLLPGTASAYERIGLPVNVRGLQFNDVKYSWEASAGRTVLEVFGNIVNITDQPLRIPTVVFGLRTKEMVEVYQWAADVRNDELPPGESAAFSAQIPSPPKSIRDVQVRFAKVR